MKPMLMLAALAALLSGTPAQASCWSPQAEKAAQVRDFETMLMVSALRCRLTGANFLADYNRFIRTSRPALTEVNYRLRAHFTQAVGPARALDAYDRYVTGIANRHGGGQEGLDCRDFAAILTAANAEGGRLEGLERLAGAAGIKPQLHGGRCPRAVAAR